MASLHASLNDIPLAAARLFNSIVEAATIPEHHNPQTASPIANLSYATYYGTALPNGVSQWLGIRYAAPPTGARRFRRAEPPLPTAQIQNAASHGPVCLPVQGAGDGTLPGTYDEDCLFIDIYAPSRPRNTKKDLLPVMLWIQGGAFVELVNFNYNGSGLATTGDVVVASFNYRVGPYGFLANDELAAEGNLNLGLQDQRTAMRWVQEHISAFGGDPSKVTLFGASVGGGSVPLQALAYGGRPPRAEEVTWRAGIGEAPYLPSVFSVAEQVFHYRDLLTATNCSDINCLRSVTSEKIQSANFAVPFPGQKSNALFAYGPVIDGSLLPDTPLNLLKEGRYLKDKPLILGSSRTEGTIFVPQANTTAEVNSFLQAQFPNITNDTLVKAQDLYKKTPKTLPGVNITLAPLFLRAAELYGDASFFCPTLDFAQSFTKAEVPVHFFIDHIEDPIEVAAGYIVPHTWELQGVWGPSNSVSSVALPGANSYEPDKVNAGMVPILQKYWTSFARTAGDVNALKAKGAPIWKAFEDGNYVWLQSNSTRMERMQADLVAKCAFWKSVKTELGQ
ncbi:hypothetical protein AC579_3733 [Pseudocercospora musae]|uniref:Carboxylesterase type B domain-containing protein n=1 Tax=Pseudocercospora musae TaxID=113226 RepID=A0A139GVW0_9PEZI|nr:hypothetical protein AC579_3733 [Pseudocercospora musae]